MKKIVLEARWTLDIHGYKHVKIIVSGGINEKTIVELRDLVDGFGVGTSIATPPSIDFSMDIVEKYIDGKWKPYTKRGKLPGAKQIYRCRPGLNDTITLLDDEPSIICPDGRKPIKLLKKYIENGEIIAELPDVRSIRDYVLEQLKEVSEPQPV